ncbi:hypothetical protein [Streptomyces sp. Ac-502]|uniref:hypothetical protein n=1 Tax=Streptomyces sp. Ac-502 TaxID=3342801 RepID=UPI0038625571
MSPWTGRMKTALLGRHVHPAEFSTWEGARRYHERYWRDRETLEHLRATIPERGIEEPLLLGVRERDKFVFVYEGHHRAVIALELGVPFFPFRWFWDPDVRDVQEVAFPWRMVG